MASIWGELKRRKVVRVVVAYGIISWLLIEVSSVLGPALRLPEWATTLVVFLLILGFPVALVLSWAYQLAPEGLTRDPEDVDAETGQQKRIPWVPAAIVSVLAVASAFYVWRSADDAPVPEQAEPQPQQTAAEEPAKRALDSVAVLPFENFSDDQQDAYFADGLADTLLHKLSQLQTLKVIARNSSFQYKGSNRDVREIGEALDVATVVEGSVQRQGEQVRVIVQLVDTSNGNHIWSETYDDTFANIFELQDRIAEAITRRLQISVSDNDRERMFRNGTDNPHAYDLLMQALNTDVDLSSTRYDPDNDPVTELIRQAIAEDERYAQAWAALANHYTSIAFAGAAPGRYIEFVDLAMEAANKTIELDPGYEGGYDAQADAHWRRGNIEEMKRNLRKALQINPNYASAMSGMALALMGTDPAAAYEYLVRAHELDPESFILYRQKYFALLGMGRLDDAVAQLYEAIERFPDSDMYHRDIAFTQLGSYGRPDLALEWMARLLERQPDNREAIEGMIRFWLEVNDIERAETWSRRLLREHPASATTSLRPARIAFITGNVGDAVALLNDIQVTQNNFYDSARLRSATCMALEDRTCVLEQADLMRAQIERMRATGGRTPARMPLSEVVTRGMSQTAEERASSDAIGSALRETRNWPVLLQGGQNFQYTGYIRAMLLAQVGSTDEAMEELDRTLEFADGGFVGTDLAGLPPDVSPYFSDLRELPGFDDWFARFSARREAMRRRMIEIADGI